MVDRRQVIGGAFRGLLSGGAWVRILSWRRASPGRAVSVQIDDSGWLVSLKQGEDEVAGACSDTFEGATMLIVTQLRKAL